MLDVIKRVFRAPATDVVALGAFPLQQAAAVVAVSGNHQTRRTRR